MTDNNKYSDNDLAEFKELIQQKIEHAEEDLTLINSAFKNDSNNGTDDTSPTFKAFEEGSETMSKEANVQLAIRQEKFIRDLKNDSNNGTDDTSPTFKAFEEGSETMSKEANVQLAIRQEKFLRDLKNALLRIENKTYGVCRETGKLIQKERLKLVPHATLSIEAKRMQQ